MQPRKLALVPALLCSVMFAAAAAAQPLACSSPQKPQQVAELMFGRKIGDRIGVSEAQWARFVDREITPRFPDGLTILDARGQWSDPDRKRIVREPSKVVTIVLPGKPEDGERLTAIVENYKKNFRQQSVAVIVRPACVSF
ncbi:MAG: hypothetical protein QOG83_30 [Alphaproteobacteria bacterium]|nr:hypothetical protein [Alphaproteobacteria bacterium]